MYVPDGAVLRPAAGSGVAGTTAGREQHQVGSSKVVAHGEGVDGLHDHLLALGRAARPLQLEALAAGSVVARDGEAIGQLIRHGRRAVRVAEEALAAALAARLGRLAGGYRQRLVVNVADACRSPERLLTAHPTNMWFGEGEPTVMWRECFASMRMPACSCMTR